MNVNGFEDWVYSELEVRQMSMAEASRVGGISTSLISLVLSGQREPTFNFCEGIAKAFNIPTVDVLERAGLVPSSGSSEASNQPPTTRELVYMYSQLDEDDRDRLLQIARAFYEAKGGKRSVVGKEATADV